MTKKTAFQVGEWVFDVGTQREAQIVRIDHDDQGGTLYLLDDDTPTSAEWPDRWRFEREIGKLKKRKT